MMNKISLCPFCASSHTFTHDALHNQYAVRCSICNAIGPDMPTIVGAIASWNKRAVQSIESPLPASTTIYTELSECIDLYTLEDMQTHAAQAVAAAAERERCIATLRALQDRSGVNDNGTAWLVRLTRGDCVDALLALKPVESVSSNAKKR